VRIFGPAARFEQTVERAVRTGEIGPAQRLGVGIRGISVPDREAIDEIIQNGRVGVVARRLAGLQAQLGASSRAEATSLAFRGLAAVGSR